MSDDRTADERNSPGAQALARNVVPVLLERIAPRADPALVDELAEAVSRPGRERLDSMVSRLLADGFPVERLIDVLIPSVARLLGDRWCSDSASFASVTIGSARLQSLVRHLSPEPAAPESGRTGAAIVLRRGRQHSLGALVAASQLRRAHVPATLCIGRPDVEAAAFVRGGGFGMVALSIPAGSDLEADAAFVESLRQASPGTPVVVGGGGIEGSLETSRIALGADFATTDIRDAARRCGLIDSPRARVVLAVGAGR